MASVHLHLDNFNAGEISPLVASRFGVEKVANGCRKLRNFIIHPHGPAFRRPGMEYMGAAASSLAAQRVRMVSFQFSASTVFVLELSAAGLRVWQNGALVTLLAMVPLPYASAELSGVQFCQVNDIVYMTHPNHEPHRLIRYADNDWRIQAVPWKWPALGDENPGSQALPDEYDTVQSFNLADRAHVGHFSGATSNPFCELTGVVGATALTIIGTPPSGDNALKRIYVQRFYTGDDWVNVASVTWTTSLPTPHPYPLSTPAGTPTNSYRIWYKGPRWTGAILRLVAGKEWDLNANGYEWASSGGDEPAPVTVPAGSWRYTYDCRGYAASFPYGPPTYAVLQKRTTPGSGAWVDHELFDPTLNTSVVVTAVAGSPLELRWRTDTFWTPQNSTNTGAAVAKIEQISLANPYQTSLAVSNAAVGAGRTLSANRAIFQAGHVGAFWQLTHRRDNAFVELVSTSAAVAATGTLTLHATNAAANLETVTIGGRVYTFKTTLTASTTANEVLRGANSTASRDNLIAAINGGAGGGTTYGSQTAPHADVTAAAGGTGISVVVSARKAGTGAHAFALTETMTEGSWGGVFMAGGVGANTVISAASTAGLRIHGKWDVSTYGSWATTLYLERLTGAGTWEFVRSWRANKDRNVSVQGETDGDETLRLRIIAGTASETSTEAAPRFILEATDARTDGLVKITAIASAVSATCDVVVACLDTTASYVWTEGAWSMARGFPRALALHEQRMWFGGTASESMRLWGSVTGDIENFRRSSLDDASISFTPSAGELNPIQWLQSQGAELLIGTLGDEWTLGGEGKPITPTNFQFQLRSRFGSAPVAAIMAGEVVAFVQRGGRKLRRIGARSDTDPWGTADMTVLAEHIALKGIIGMTFMSNPTPILWAWTNDGKLLGMTLEVEQNVFGWHVHETDGTVESVAVVYGTDSDEVWLAVLRGGVRSIERLDPLVFTRDWTRADEMIFADSAKRYSFGLATTAVTGLDHLNGKTVKVLADGAAHADRVVAAGAITLAAPASTVVVGLPYTSELQPTKRDVQTDKGTAQGRLWRTSRVGAVVHESRGGLVAEAPTSRFETLPYAAGAALYSGDLETAVESTARKSVDVTVKTDAPLPFNLVSLVLKLDLYGD